MAQIIKIDGKDFDVMVEYGSQYNKLYGEAYRDMAGYDRSELIGAFPKLHCTTGKLHGDMIQHLVKAAMKPEFEVEWFDINKGKMSKGMFYMNDPTFKLKRYSDRYYEPVSFNLIIRHPY